MKKTQSEIARLLEEIEAAYAAGQAGLSGLAEISGHERLLGHTERMANRFQELGTLVGPDEAMALIAQRLEHV